MYKNLTPRSITVSVALIAFSALLSPMLSSCDLPPIYEYWDSLVLNELEISPSFLALQVGQAATFSVLGGKGPYTFELTGNGALSALASDSVEYSAPGAATTVVLTVRDKYDAQSLAQVMVETTISSLAIVPATISLSHGGSFDLGVNGGMAPYIYTLESGLGTVDETTGFYTAPVLDTDAVVRLEDGSGQMSDALISVRAGVPPLLIDPVSLEIDKDALFTFSVSGGVPPYSFIVESGVGSINPVTGEYFSNLTGGATVRVTDSCCTTTLATITVSDVPATPLVISPRSLKLKKGKSYQFSAEGGDPPYTFSMIFSYGGTIDPVSGVYNAPNSHPGVEFVKVEDSLGRSDWTTVKIKNH